MTVDELKNLQNEIIRKNKLINRVFLVLILVVMLVIILLIKEIKFLLFGISAEIIIFLIALAITKSIANGKNIRIFNNEFKNVFVLKFLQKYFENLIYKPEIGFTVEEIRKIGILSTGDRYNSNDYISGGYNGINFEQSDIHIEEEHEETDKDGNKKEVWETIFKGRLMVFDFNKNFRSNVKVVSSGFSASMFPSEKHFCRVKMEDDDFNKNFAIYSETEHDAFYILTPHFMEKLKNIYKELGCGMMLDFIDNKLYIAIDNHEDSFEYNVYKKINEEEIEKNIVKDINIIINFVNDLDLENDLFRREV